MTLISVANLNKSFPSEAGPARVLKDVTFGVERGRFVTLFGPNGCGKTTLVHIIAGIEPADSGTAATHLEEGEGVALVFQDYRSTLLPWRDVRNNILFPLHLRGVGRREASDRLDRLLSQLEVTISPEARVYNLSGGQAQLVCLLRALILEPQVLILDEPFSALDYQTSVTLREKIMEIWQRMGLTVLFVSHDLDEALYLGDETVFLSRQPASVVEILPITLGRPRRPEVQGTAEFAALKLKALDAFSRCLGRP